MIETTTTLRDGTVVTARTNASGDTHAWTYANRTQAEKAAARNGGTVIKRGRPWYVTPKVQPKPYLTSESPEAFIDHALMQPHDDCTELCPTCKGHGGWNLELNAYALPDATEDTPENRKKFCHFRASCTACWGWGYIQPGTCAHDWGSTGNRWKCRKCTAEITVDSSD